MPFEGVVVVALGTESPRPPEGHSVEAMALLCLLLILLLLLQLLSRFDHRQAAASVAVGQWVSPCEEHLWDVSAHGRLTQAGQTWEGSQSWGTCSCPPLVRLGGEKACSR